MYTLFEMTLFGLIVAFSTYHVLKLLMPKTMRRLLIAVGARLGRSSAGSSRKGIASRLQSLETDGGCGGCSGAAGCGSCHVADSIARSRIDRSEKPAV